MRARGAGTQHLQKVRKLLTPLRNITNPMPPAPTPNYSNANSLIQKKHFDWTEVERQRKSILEKNEEQMVVVSLIRDPVERAASHFNYIKFPSEKR